MQYEQNIEKLRSLRLLGMAESYIRQTDDVNSDSLPFHVRFGQCLDAEEHSREQRRLARSLKQAKLKHSGACIENLNYAAQRGLDKSFVMSLAECQWVKRNQHIILTGSTGGGKTYLACALGHQAIRHGYKVLYKRLPRFLEELEVAHVDGSLPKLRIRLTKFDVLILDDWAVNPISARNRRDLFEIIEDKSGEGSIIITSQLPVNKWHEWIGEPTVADAILDRLVHRSHKINLQGESMRKHHAVNSGE